MSLAGLDANKDGREDILSYTGTPVYDSLVLILQNNYTYGDITLLHTLRVHQLTEIMNYHNDMKLYNGSSFAYDPTAIGTKSIYLQNPSDPESINREIRVKLNDTFGSSLFNLAKDNDYHIYSNEYFKELLKGLVLVPDPGNESILGYSTNPFMRLYYHDDADPTTSRTYDFVKRESDIHFNRITNDRSSTNLSSLQKIYEEVPSKLTNNTSYTLTGINLFTKFNFPYLNQIRRQYPNAYVTKAFLVIHPQVNSFDENYYLPNQLALFNTDYTNYPGTILGYKDLAVAQVVDPNVYLAIPEKSEYTFEITEFVTSEMETVVYSRKGLFLGSPTSVSGIRAERLSIPANTLSNNNNVKLVLYLSVFNQ
jgi:hypothetical protein